MENQIIIQRFKNECLDDFDLVKRYYKIVLGINNIHVTEKELNLICYSALHGTISTPPVRDGFIKMFDIPLASMYNMSAKLQKRGVFIKGDDGKIKVHPSISPSFEYGKLLLVINLNVKENGTNEHI